MALERRYLGLMAKAFEGTVTAMLRFTLYAALGLAVCGRPLQDELKAALEPWQQCEIFANSPFDGSHRPTPCLLSVLGLAN